MAKERANIWAASRKGNPDGFVVLRGPGPGGSARGRIGLGAMIVAEARLSAVDVHVDRMQVTLRDEDRSPAQVVRARGVSVRDGHTLLLVGTGGGRRLVVAPTPTRLGGQVVFRDRPS